MSKTIPFNYFGSKSHQFDFIDSKLPRTRQYIEPYGGVATVLINRDPVPVETYNDLHGDIPAFFKVLRDRPADLIDALRKTPYSREEYQYAIEQRRNGYPDCDDFERARLFFVIMQQSRSMRKFGDETSWSYAVKGAGRPTAGYDGTTAANKHRIEETLEHTAGRFRDVQIENRPAIDVIETHDRETATFYVDPPYPHPSRGSDDNYALEMSDADHRELAAVLDECEGYVAVSGYDGELYNALYDDWYRYDDKERPIGDGERRVEVLWTNYDADEIGGEKFGVWGEPRRKGKQLTLTGAVE